MYDYKLHVPNMNLLWKICYGHMATQLSKHVK